MWIRLSLFKWSKDQGSGLNATHRLKRILASDCKRLREDFCSSELDRDDGIVIRLD